MSKFIYSFGIIVFGLGLGYGLQVLNRSGRLRLPLPIEDLRKLLQKVALLGLNPVAIVGAIWIVSIQDAGLIALPFVGLLALVSGGLLALGASRMMRLAPAKTGALFCCGSFTNIGSIGALICFVFLGEAGFALVPIYKLFEEVSYYSIGFPIAKFYSGAVETDAGVAARLKALCRDPFILVAVSSLVLGGLVNLSGLERPAFYGTVNAVVVPLATILLLTSIGLALRFSRVGAYLKECVSVATIKFVMVPVGASSLAWAIGFGDIDQGLPLKVVIILSSMPVAFNALIPPSIYDLDLDLANSCWFFTTALLVLVLPLQLVILNLM
ncbi:MAG TPA: AEC family transporter [Desulfobacterales bacterium]